MKKIILSFIATMCMLVMAPIVKADSDVTVYMFTKNGCPACEAAREYFEGLLEKDKDAFKLVNIEVWCGDDYTVDPNSPEWILGSEDAYNLLMAAVEYYKLDETQLGTPVIAIGDYARIGFNSSDPSDITDAIAKAKKSKKEVDVIKDLAKKNDIELSSVIKDFDVKSCDKTLADTTKSSGKYDAIIIVSIFVVLIGGFAGLVVLGRKN